MYKICDLYLRFQARWDELSEKGLGEQLKLWQRYLSHCPELWEKQVSCYAEEGFDWRAIAKERVLPHLAERRPAMERAREVLHRLIGPVCLKAQERLGLDFEVLFVIYVGMGCGAGWATELCEKPACLLGLENIAELGWLEEDMLSALLAHELGHLLHGMWRKRAGLEGLEEHTDPFWQLYIEGFAQRCEHLIGGKETWHEAGGQPGWLDWCRKSKGRLAALFLEKTGKGDARDFFGSWSAIEGRSQTGYFLGHEMIKGWEKGATLREIAVLPAEEVRRRAKKCLARLAAEDALP
ncbi:TPA: hypothetical protein DCL37_03365 [Candidatus Acetothermia bacterium]|nr:hypothetical protein [Candidatus Acetothermia bacterium]